MPRGTSGPLPTHTLGTWTWPTDCRAPMCPDWGAVTGLVREAEPALCPSRIPAAPVHKRWAAQGTVVSPLSPWITEDCACTPPAGGGGVAWLCSTGNTQSLWIQAPPSPCLCTGLCWRNRVAVVPALRDWGTESWEPILEREKEVGVVLGSPNVWSPVPLNLTWKTYIQRWNY